MSIVKHYPKVKGKIQSDDSFYCPYCKTEQAEHPLNILDGDTCASYECDECGKKIFCEKTVLITYWSSK